MPNQRAPLHVAILSKRFAPFCFGKMDCYFSNFMSCFSYYSHMCSFAHYFSTLIYLPSCAALLCTFPATKILPSGQLRLHISQPVYSSLVGGFAYNFPTLITPPSWSASLTSILSSLLLPRAQLCLHLACCGIL